ncbi:MAG: sodium:solute symporter [Nitrospinae bacterium]|nr:sodium:solute symporter [Nitrospinota bacterium]
MSWLDLAVLAVYFAGITLFGAFFYGRSKTAEGFTAAGGRLSGLVVGVSIFGTYLSSITFLALPGKAYTKDWGALAFSLSLPVAAYIAVKWFVPLYRKLDDVSAYAYLERRFGLWARLYAATCYLLTQQARMGTILFLVALALESLTGWDIIPVIILTGVSVMAYAALGGIEAVIWTDVAQSVILTLGALVSAGALLLKMPEGPGQLFSITADSGKFSMGSFEPSFYSATFWTVLIYGLFINLQNFGIDQSYIQRYKTASSLDAARRSVWIGALTYIPVSALFLFIGAGLFAFYSASPELLPPELAAQGMGDKVYPHFIVTQLPPGMVGLVIAALMAAAMSTIATSLNSSATVLLTDMRERLSAKPMTDREKVAFLRVSTLLLGLLGTGIALLMISIKTALDAWWNLAGIFSGGMLGLFLLGALSRRTGSVQALAGVAVGVVVIAWATFAREPGAWFSNPLDSLMTVVIGTLAIFITGGILSRGQKRMEKLETVFDLNVDR